MKKLLLLVTTLFSVLQLFCQQPAPKFGITFSGFVRTDIFYDTRENVSLREGHFLLYPENIMKDVTGNDINKNLNFNILSINSRLKGNITGPDALGAKTTGVMEAEFFGMSESDVNGFRLRHAYVKMQWPKSEFMAGQFWHPMFHEGCFPQTVSFNTGAPFQPFNRSPQLRLVYHTGRADWMVAAVAERDFTSYGPNPSNPASTINNSVFMRNSGLPEFQFRIQYNLDSAHNNFFGAGLGTKTLKPELYTLDTGNNKVRSDAVVSSWSAYVFGKICLRPFIIRMQGILAQNAADLSMLGGYALEEITDPVTGKKKYTPLSTFAAWVDLSDDSGLWRPGFFAGVSSNLGAGTTLKDRVFYSRGSNIAYLYRLAPRITYTSGKLVLSLEAEYTTAAYGIIGKKGVVHDSEEVSNFRPLLVICYNF